MRGGDITTGQIREAQLTVDGDEKTLSTIASRAARATLEMLEVR